MGDNNLIRLIKYSQEHRSWQTLKHGLLAVALVSATLQAGGCIGGAVDQPSGQGPEQVSGELRLVKADYPIPGKDGSVICSVHEYDGVDGLTYTVREQYDEGFAKLRAALRADADLERVASEQGVSAIDTCDDARKFTKIWDEYIESKPSIQRKPEPDSTGLPMEGSTELIEKVKDSSNFAGKAVGLRIWESGGVTGCSGYFIADHIVVTAAHCLEGNGDVKVTVEATSGCVYPYLASCTVEPTFENAWGQRHDSYGDGGSSAHDIAVLELEDMVASPMNSSDNWMRVATSSAWEGESVWLDAWGANSIYGTGFGTQRLSLETIEIDWLGSQHFYYYAVTGEGRQCHGDSGGPTIATGLASQDVVIGNTSNSDKTGDNACPSSGQKARQTGEWDNEDFLRDWAGPCNEYVGYSNTFTYLRCW